LGPRLVGGRSLGARPAPLVRRGRLVGVHMRAHHVGRAGCPSASQSRASSASTRRPIKSRMARRSSVSVGAEYVVMLAPNKRSPEVANRLAPNRDGSFACKYASSMPSDQVTAHHLIRVIRAAGWEDVGPCPAQGRPRDVPPRPPAAQDEVLSIAEKWRPYRSLATSYLFSAAYEDTAAVPTQESLRAGVPRRARGAEPVLGDRWGVQ
jgi:hypothetical protein